MRLISWGKGAISLMLLTLLTFGGSVGGKCGNTPTDDDSETAFTLTSAASSGGFDAGSAIPVEFACDDTGGSDELPTLSWTNPPSGTLSFAITMVDTSTDPDTTHMVLFDISSSTTSVDDEADFAQSNFAVNYNNTRGYDGPCPPTGETHTYRFTIYGLSIANLSETGADTTSASDVITKIEANDLASDSVSGTFTATQ